MDLIVIVNEFSILLAAKKVSVKEADTEEINFKKCLKCTSDRQLR